MIARIIARILAFIGWLVAIGLFVGFLVFLWFIDKARFCI